MAPHRISLLASARRFAKGASGTQRVVECDQQDSSLVLEQLRAQGWDSAEVGTEDGRTAIRVDRPGLSDEDDLRARLEESGFDVTED